MTDLLIEFIKDLLRDLGYVLGLIGCVALDVFLVYFGKISGRSLSQIRTLRPIQGAVAKSKFLQFLTAVASFGLAASLSIASTRVLHNDVFGNMVFFAPFCYLMPFINSLVAEGKGNFIWARPRRTAVSKQVKRF